MAVGLFVFVVLMKIYFFFGFIPAASHRFSATSVFPEVLKLLRCAQWYTGAPSNKFVVTSEMRG